MARRILLALIFLSGLPMPGASQSPEISEFPMPLGSGPPTVMKRGPDGQVWVGGWSGLGTVSSSGTITPSKAGGGLLISDFTFDAAGTLWYAQTSKIGRVPRVGASQEFDLPNNTGPFRIVAGEDGGIWYTGAGRIGRISDAGTTVEFPVPGSPVDLTAGPDGNIWFTEAEGRVAKIDRAGAVTE